MRGKRFILASVLCVLLSGCGCEHEWTEVTCTAPKTCIQCGETEGENLAHVQGEAVFSNVDVMTATADFVVPCMVCGDTLEAGTGPADRLHDGNKFLFTDPWQWQERQLMLGEEDGLNSVGMTTKEGDCVIQLYQDTDFISRCVFFNGDDFVSDRNESMEFNRVRTYLGLNCGLYEIAYSERLSSLATLHAVMVMRTCDPMLTNETGMKLYQEILQNQSATFNGLSYEMYIEDGCFTLVIQVTGE